MREFRGGILLEYADTLNFGQTLVYPGAYSWDGLTLYERQWPHRQFALTDPEHVAAMAALFL